MYKQVFKKDGSIEIRPYEENDKPLKDGKGKLIEVGQTLMIWNGFGLYYKQWKVVKKTKDGDFEIKSEESDDLLKNYSGEVNEDGDSISIKIIER